MDEEDFEDFVCLDGYGLPMTAAEFATTAANDLGCCMCGSPIEPADDFMWHGDLAGNAICETCKD